MTTPQPLNTGSLGPAGNNQSHTNIQPYLTINWCIALVGIFPSRN
jgi:microcystin-dependent protein